MIYFAAAGVFLGFFVTFTYFAIRGWFDLWDIDTGKVAVIMAASGAFGILLHGVIGLLR